MKNLFYRLMIYLDTASETDTNYFIALFMANNFYRIPDMRISELAEECFVSPATISRFCRALGYENFAHLKQECNSFHSNNKKFNNLINIDLECMAHSPEKATEEFTQQIIESTAEISKILDWKILDEVLHLIHDHEEVAFFGTQFSTSAAILLQTDLLMLEKFTIAYMDSERQLECAKQMTKDSVAIVISLNGNFEHVGHKVLQYLNKSKCHIVWITSTHEDNLGIPVEYKVLVGGSLKNKTTKHALLTAVQLMSLRYYSLFCPDLKSMKKKLV